MCLFCLCVDVGLVLLVLFLLSVLYDVVVGM